MFVSVKKKVTVFVVIQNWSGTDAVSTNVSFVEETFEMWSRLNFLVRHI